MDVPTPLSLMRCMSEACAEAVLSPTPAASFAEEDTIIPPTDSLADEVAVLQDVIDEFFVRFRVLLEVLEKRTTA